MAGGGDMTEDFERAGGITLDVSDCDKEDHYGISWFVGPGGRGPADDTLEVCAFKVPAGTVSSPNLCFESILGTRE